MIDNRHAGVTNALPAAQARTGQIEIFMQEVDHHQPFRHLDRAILFIVDGQEIGWVLMLIVIPHEYFLHERANHGNGGQWHGR